MTPPRYPKDAMDAGLEGSVELKIRMDASGIPQQIVILRSQPAGVFDAAVLAAARQWRLVPDKVHGRPVPTTVRVPVQFALDPPDEVAVPPGTDAPAAAGAQPARCAASACAAKKG
nr:energy transducer TonB [Xanthomonas campestris]